MQKFDLIVIGAGSGGLVAASTAVQLGASVALVEMRDEIGGDCLHSGCVPSKALIAAARHVHAIEKGDKLGVTAKAKVNFNEVKKHIAGTIKAVQTRDENDGHYESLGIKIFHGRAGFAGNHTIVVNEEKLTANKIIIATGSSAAIPEIDGLKNVPYVTNETVFSMKELPARLAVIGGGPIGCELGQALAMLGSKVTIIQSNDRLLPREESIVSASLQTSFKDMGIDTRLSHKVEALSKTTVGTVISLSSDAGKSKIEVDMVLLAAGRKPNLDLDLEKAGINSNERGIIVNDRLQSSNPDVYAVGDCCGQYQFTHYAAQQATIAVRNAMFKFSSKQNFKAVPWTTFTTPEIAHVGQATSELQSSKSAFHEHELNYEEIDKALAENQEGTILVLTDTADKKILGATIIGENAGDIIAPIVMLMNLERPFTDLSKGMLAYPTYSIGLKQLASKIVLSKFAKSKLLNLLRS